MSLELLTRLSTTAIVLSGLSLLIGWYFIKRRHDIDRHRWSMLAATGFAGAFLVLYVTRWALYGSKAFEGEGLWRLVYFTTLIPHVLLAMAVGPLAAYLIYLALGRKDYRKHRRWARVTLPVWLFVAASGWAIYWMLYKMTF